ncbi:cytosolic arginine sensor for mTORC1 subunit 1-like [Diadema setosum]|uniref:cytosolic arginine sensor for mTORC1 subunit 1-like n=1 Tax=Diadema setosum TaxID=31175 RepID=UPI003B3BE8EE
MELHILEHRLRVATVKRSDLLPFIGSLVKLALLHEQSKSKFFSCTQTSLEFTIILDEEGFKALPEQAQNLGMVIQPSTWLVLEAGAGIGDEDEGVGMTTITRNIIVPLANQHLSIFCLSTCQTDYVLVKEEDLQSVIQCLSPDFRVYREVDGNTELVTVNMSHNGVNEAAEAKPATMYPLHFPSNHFLVTSLQPDELPKLTSCLLQVLFYPETYDSIETSPSSKKEKFVSYSLIDDRISLVLDGDLLDRFPDNCICVDSSKERWKMVKTGVQNLGFEESGIVAQVAKPLASEDIPIFYLSTFLTDHTLVPEAEWEKTLSVLSQRHQGGPEEHDDISIEDP